MMRQGLNGISVMVLNQCASIYGDASIAAMSIVSRVINFLFCIGLGLGQGFQPVSAFNYGAKKYSRVKEAFRFTCCFSIGIMCVAASVGFLFAEPIIRIFRDDAAVIAIGTRALRLQCISLLFLPVSLGGNMLFQSIGKSGCATFLASIRSDLIFIPVLLIFSRYMGLLGIEMSQMAADMISAAITLPMVIRFLSGLPEDEPDKK